MAEMIQLTFNKMLAELQREANRPCFDGPPKGLLRPPVTNWVLVDERDLLPLTSDPRHLPAGFRKARR